MRKLAKIGLTALMLLVCLNLTMTTPLAAQTGKIPVTTSSPEARAAFLQGRDLSENLRNPEALPLLEKAVQLDPNFAYAYYYLTQAQTTTPDFFAYLEKATAASAKASDGERLLIQALQASANAQIDKAGECYRKAAQMYPSDERAHEQLGTYYFGLQQYGQAAAELQQAVQINPDFAPAYNMLGYAQKYLGDYPAAEQALAKYVELIPNDPNPHDSYAELLMKMGRYEESITHYRKALELDPSFAASHIGIASNLIYLGKPDQARAELEKLYSGAVNGAQRRAACFQVALSYLDEGKANLALKSLRRGYSIAEKAADSLNMANDLGTMGMILLDSDKPDEAARMFEQSLLYVKRSSVSPSLKDQAVRNFLYQSALVACNKKDYVTAQRKSEEFAKRAQDSGNPIQIQKAHELAGIIALHLKNYDHALDELSQANQNDPYNLCRIGHAYAGKGDQLKADEYFNRVASFNELNQLNLALVRCKAKQLLAMK